MVPHGTQAAGKYRQTTLKFFAALHLPSRQRFSAMLTARDTYFMYAARQIQQYQRITTAYHGAATLPP